MLQQQGFGGFGSGGIAMTPGGALPPGAGGGGGGGSCGSGGCGHSHGGHSHAVPSAEVGQKVRGEMTGDACFTINVGVKSTSAAVLNEVKLSIVPLELKSGMTTLPSKLSVTKDWLDFCELDANARLSQNPDSIGVSFGSRDSGSGSGSGGKTTPLSSNEGDIVSPLHLLPACLDSEIYTVPLTNASSAKDITPVVSLKVNNGTLLSSYFYLWGAASSAKIASLRDSGDLKKPGKAKAGSKKKEKLFVSITHPSYFGLLQKQQIIQAAVDAGYSVKNVFSRGLAAVAGALQNESSSKVVTGGLLSIIESQKLPKTPTSAASSSTSTSACDDMYVFFVDANCYGTDLALIRCEGVTSSLKMGCDLPCERIVSIKLGGDPIVKLDDLSNSQVSDDEILEKVKGNISSFFDELDSSFSSNCCAVLTTDDTPKKIANEITMIVKGRLGKNVPHIMTKTANVAIGGCCLAAAELNSSKQYIMQEDNEWRIVHSLPIGEDTTVYPIILQEQLTAESESKNSTLWSAGDRLGKPDFGSIEMSLRAKITKPVAIERSYKLASSLSYEWPKITISEVIGENNLRSIHKSMPLRIIDPVTKESTVVESANVTVKMDPFKAILLYVEKERGITMIERDRKKSRTWGFISILVAIVGIFISIYLSKLYYVAQVEMDDKQWMRDFFSEYDPTKITEVDALYSKFQSKYKGSSPMFMLWRKLSKKYDVTVTPPTSIKDE